MYTDVICIPTYMYRVNPLIYCPVEGLGTYNTACNNSTKSAKALRTIYYARVFTAYHIIYDDLTQWFVWTYTLTMFEMYSFTKYT